MPDGRDPAARLAELTALIGDTLATVGSDRQRLTLLRPVWRDLLRFTPLDPERYLPVRLTVVEVQALLAAAHAGAYEYGDAVDGDPDASLQLKTARRAALQRALEKLEREL